MKKVIIEGNEYFVNDGIFYDAQNIRVDLTTNQRLHKLTNNIYNTNSKKTYISISQPTAYSQRYVSLKNGEENKKIEPTKIEQTFHQFDNKFDVLFSHTSSHANLHTNDIKPQLFEYGLTPNDIIYYNEQVDKYNAKRDEIAAHNQYVKEQKEKTFTKSFWWFLTLFFVCNIFYLGILGKNITVLSSVIILLISIGVPFLFYKINVVDLVEKSQVELKDFVDEDMIDSVNRYNSDLLKYDEELRRTTKVFWQNLNCFDFENEIANLFNALGASAYTTSKVNDGGYDVVVHYKGKIYAVECKHHQNPVGPAMVDRLRGVLNQTFDKGIFVSLNGYTYEAKKRNKESSNEIILLDINNIIRLAETKNLDLYL